MAKKKLQHFFDNLVFTRKKSMVSRCNQALCKRTHCPSIVTLALLLFLSISLSAVQLQGAFLCYQLYQHLSHCKSISSIRMLSS